MLEFVRGVLIPSALDAVIEILTWTGWLAAVVFGVLRLALWAMDGTWLSADGYIDHEGDRVLVRWITSEGVVDHAEASAEQAVEIGSRDAMKIFYRHNSSGRMRLSADTPALRAVGSLAWGGLALGIVCLVASWILLFVR